MAVPERLQRCTLRELCFCQLTNIIDRLDFVNALCDVGAPGSKLFNRDLSRISSTDYYGPDKINVLIQSSGRVGI